MCLAVPVQVTKIIDEKNVEVQLAEDSFAKVGTALLVEDVKVGDYIITHAGFALRVLDLHEAEETLKLFAQMAEIPKSEAYY